ncbi:MAG: hypothetical protein SFV55_13905 [Haliscomenobacter sp.]|uniref:hypothetical protein n=1 Tax=Haliscomenobacter sp. TaxID=2717303 RepID=UPI0029B29DBA|nr:hypothetical protein [Haliscomenobacter sp.]MDX2069517.1 hypothetical protein [Haliscomenobacter sp.]
MKFLNVLILIFIASVLHAHSPDLSNLMIYEQNGKCFLLMKSSLTAFEGEVDFHFKKNAYKTPEEFEQLVIKHFKRNCFVVINRDTIKLSNTQVKLGHETTLFAELKNPPQKIESCYIRNTFFKDMPSNQCELVLTTKDLPQKQFIFNKENKQEVNLRVENNQWVVEKAATSIFQQPNPLLWAGIFSTICIVAIAVIKKGNIV